MRGKTSAMLRLRDHCIGRAAGPGAAKVDLPVGTVAIVGADGTEGREELRALLDAEQARRKMAERRYAEALLPPVERAR